MKLGFFSAEQTRQLAKISASQLRYWDQTGVFRPKVLEGAGAFRRVYSFRDVVGLRTISILRNKYRVGLDGLRRIEQKLKEAEADWSSIAFYVGEDRRIYFVDPGSKDAVAIKPMGQKPLFKLQAIARRIEGDLTRMRRRTGKQIGKVDQSRFIMRNAHVVAGTRIPTSAIWEYHKAGYTDARILEQFPRLAPQDVKAAIQWESLKVKEAAG